MKRDLSHSAILTMAALESLGDCIARETELLDWSLTRNVADRKWMEAMTRRLNAGDPETRRNLRLLEASVASLGAKMSLMDDKARQLALLAARSSLDRLAIALWLSSLPPSKPYSKEALKELGSFLADVGTDAVGLGVGKSAWEKIAGILSRRGKNHRIADDELLQEAETRLLMYQAALGLEAQAEWIRRLLAAVNGGPPNTEVTPDDAALLLTARNDRAEKALT